MAKEPQTEYNEAETQKRFEAALRGARIAGHKPLKEKPKKREASKPAPRLSSRKKSGDNR
jgi:hypothetical protein